MHTVTRIEGFEGCSTSNFTAAFNGQGGTVGVVSSPVRTGVRAARVNPASGATGFFLLRNRWDATGVEDATNLAAAICRFYFRIETPPLVDSRFFSFIDNASADRMVLEIDPTGVIQFGTTLGTTVLSINTWYRIEVKYVDGVGGEVRINGLIELSNLTVTAGGVTDCRFGRNTAPATLIDFFYDDIVIETDASQANIDYPGAGVVRRVELVADGTDDPTTWTQTTAGGNLYVDVDGDVDGDSGLIVSPLGDSSATFAIQTAEQAGVELAPLACQISIVVRDDTSGTPRSVVRTRLRSGATINETSNSNTGDSYDLRIKVYNTDPNTSLGWTRIGAASVEPGLHHIASSDETRCTLVLWQVAEPIPESIEQNTILTQFEQVTGALRSVTNYGPEIRTVRITSEAYGRPNEAFNIIAASLRYVPNGVGTLRGFWRFDEQTTRSFSIPANPFSFDNLGTRGDTEFTFNDSAMVRGDEVYVKHIPIDGSGKFFEITFEQSGNRGWEILALDLEVTPEGRREAFVDGGF